MLKWIRICITIYLRWDSNIFWIFQSKFLNVILIFRKNQMFVPNTTFLASDQLVALLVPVPFNLLLMPVLWVYLPKMGVTQNFQQTMTRDLRIPKKLTWTFLLRKFHSRLSIQTSCISYSYNNITLGCIINIMSQIMQSRNRFLVLLHSKQYVITETLT